MPGLLVESLGGGAAAGFGAKPGFGFGWGNGISPMHTWTSDTGALTVGAAYFGLGVFIKDFPGHPEGASVGTFGDTLAGFDYVNQDQSDFGPGYTAEAFGQWGIGIQRDVPADGYFRSGSAPNVVPFLLGGNDLKTAMGKIVPGYGGDPAITQGAVVGSDYVVTGVGFQPDLVMFLGGTSDPGPTNGLRVTVGMMDAAGNQWVCSELGVFATAPTIIGGLFGYSVRMSEFRTDSCFLTLRDQYGFSTAQMDRNRFSFVSMDSDGFTIHNEESNAYFAYTYFMAFKINNPAKGFFQVGTHVQGDTSLGTYPLDPEGVLLCGDSWSASIDGSPPPVWTGASVSNRAVMSVGGFDALTNRSTVGGAGSGGASQGDPFMYYDDSAIIFADVENQTTLGRGTGSLGTLTAGLSWDVDDGGARPFGSLAFRCPNVLNPVMHAKIPAERP